MNSTEESYLMEISPAAREVRDVYYDGLMSRNEYIRRIKTIWDEVAVPRLNALIPPCLLNIGG